MNVFSPTVEPPPTVAIGHTMVFFFRCASCPTTTWKPKKQFSSMMTLADTMDCALTMHPEAIFAVGETMTEGSTRVANL